VSHVSSPIADLVLFGWIPVIFLIFWYFPTRKAILVSFVAGWLFLPMAYYHFPGIPQYDKISATCGGILLATLVFDSKRIQSLSYFPSIVDLPMLIWCLCPIATAYANDPEISTKDGIQWALEHAVSWGLPYLIGRIYFDRPEALRDLAKAVFIGGLIYTPLCLFEIRFSPELHLILYGYHQHDFLQEVRLGGYRPLVFMEHGLAVGMFMTCATLSGLWLWRTGALTKIFGMRVGAPLAVLAATTVLCKSMGALVFLGVGIATLYTCKWMRTGLPLMLLMLIPPLYVGERVFANYNGENLPALLERVMQPDRIQSLMFRIGNEKQIAARAEQRFYMGWGGYGRPFISDGHGKTKYTPDSSWIISFGTYGAVGLVALLCLTLPVAMTFWRMPPDGWGDPRFAGVCVFGMLLILYSMDNLLNSMVNPLFILGLGGLCGLARSGNTWKEPRIQAPVAPRALRFSTHRSPQVAFSREI
jgi:hypothetical protein